MEQETGRRALRLSYLVSLGFALVLAGSFFTYTSFAGGYNALARYGGAIWIALLSLIVALPTITPLLKKRLGDKEE